MSERMYRLTYDAGGGLISTWEKTAAELLTANGDEPLIAWMLREADKRGAGMFTLSLIGGIA